MMDVPALSLYISQHLQSTWSTNDVCKTSVIMNVPILKCNTLLLPLSCRCITLEAELKLLKCTVKVMVVQIAQIFLLNNVENVCFCSPP